MKVKSGFGLVICVLLSATIALAEIPPGYTIIDLGTIAGDWDGSLTRPWGINESEQVVGQSQPTSGGPHAFLWDRIDGIQDLGFPSGGSESRAYDINDNGLVTGYWQEDHGPSGPTYNRAFIWNNGIGTTLGTLGGPHSFGMAGNNYGHVVG